MQITKKPLTIEKFVELHEQGVEYFALFNHTCNKHFEEHKADITVEDVLDGNVYGLLEQPENEEEELSPIRSAFKDILPESSVDFDNILLTKVFKFFLGRVEHVETDILNLQAEIAEKQNEVGVLKEKLNPSKSDRDGFDYTIKDLLTILEVNLMSDIPHDATYRNYSTNKEQLLQDWYSDLLEEIREKL
jgi:hypothetical protein